MKKYLKFFIIIFTSLFFTGCWDQIVYEQIGFIMQVGIESSKTNRLLISYTSPVADPRKKEQSELLSTDVGLLREFRENSKRVSAKLLMGGKIQQVIISDTLAGKGILNLLEIFKRDPANPDIAYVIISETSPRELLDYSQKLGDKPLPAFYLNQLIENNFQTGLCPNTSVFDFCRDSLAEGIDPITPIVKIEDEMGKGIRINGSALFSHDKMVGKMNPKQTSLLLAMKGMLKQTEYIFTSPGPPKNDFTGKSGAAVTLFKPKRKIEVKIANDIPTVKVYLAFKGDYDEHELDHIDKKEMQKKYETMFAEELKYECTKLLKYTQEIGSDPLGIGSIISSKYNPFWKQHNWEEAYKGVVFDLNITVDIGRYGLIK